jgi:hypothetical protein
MMKMELGYQWDLLEEEIPTVFVQLLDSINHCLTNLQSEIRGKKTRALKFQVKR